jgi:hypothetical protein
MVVELPHGLMIAGAVLVVAGLIGVLISGKKKADEVSAPPAEPLNTSHPMPPLPKLLGSKSKNSA